MNKTNIILLIALALILTACTNNPSNNSADNKPVQIANPASKFCIDNGGTLDIRTAADGSQTGYCKFSSGNECEEWAFMRGECKQAHICTAEEKANKACTREYMPVCGSDDKTYANKCTACSEGIESWTPEACAINYNVTEVLDESCQTDQECSTPMNYLIRSSCPYTTKCLDEKCTVVCPIYTNGKYPDVKECGTCPQYSPSALPPDFCKNGRIVDSGKDECGCQKPPTCENVACTMEAKICSDGITYVGRVGPNCEFEPCPNELPIITTHYCTVTEKAAEICTMDYNPVCGDDNLTYGNGCSACAAKVDYWKSGECA